jgi:hypothetical protein
MGRLDALAVSRDHLAAPEQRQIAGYSVVTTTTAPKENRIE